MAQDSRPRIVPELLENGEDVTIEKDRALVLRAVNMGLATERQLKVFIAGVHLEFALIRHALGLPESPRGAKFDPDSSYNTISVEFSRTAAALYAQAKDPKNPLTVADVISIAQGTIARAKRESDASKLKTRRERSWALWMTILAAVLTVIGEAIAAHYGWHP